MRSVSHKAGQLIEHFRKAGSVVNLNRFHELSLRGEKWVLGAELLHQLWLGRVGHENGQ